MPLPNRVTPFGELLTEPARCLLLGNRGGRFHDPDTRALRTRRWASKQWIVCVLDFKDRHRDVWRTGYTELFFLDEVTALGAGHRPCCECRRAAARGFQAALAAAGEPPLSLAGIDARLHAERLDGRGKRLHQADVESLPDGAMMALGDEAFAVRGGAALPWTPSGYGAPRPYPSGLVDVLTPPLTLKALRGGYVPLWHPTAAPIPHFHDMQDSA